MSNETPANVPAKVGVVPSATPISAPVTQSAPIDASQVAELLAKMSALEAKVEETRAPLRAAVAAPSAEAVDWAQVTEAHVADLQFPIPVYEHEIPDFMTINLKSAEHVAKWIHKMPSHLGTMLASGYEIIKKDDIDPHKPQVLNFNSEGHLVYDDVIACKIHKSRYFGKVRREHLKSTQIKGISGYAKVKGALNQAVANIPGMESAMNRGAMSFYGENAEANVEQVTL